MNRDNNDIPWKTEFDQTEKLAILDFANQNFALIGFDLESQDNNRKFTPVLQKLINYFGSSERARYYKKLASLLELQARPFESDLHYGGTVSHKDDHIQWLTDPAFLDAIKDGMTDDYWFINELRKLRLRRV